MIGSNRPQRICPQIAGWVQRSLNSAGIFESGLIDLEDVGLPFLDEPAMASLGHYRHDHTVRWSELVQSYDGFIFVFPQYNWGYPAVLKNALDFLYDEWANKPAALVTYGSRGGGLAAAQLGQVLQGLHMRRTQTNVELKTHDVAFTADGNLHEVDEVFAGYLDQMTALGFELEQMVTGTA